MTDQSFQVVPIGHVVGGRVEPTDDYWGGPQSIIGIDGSHGGRGCSFEVGSPGLIVQVHREVSI